MLATFRIKDIDTTRSISCSKSAHYFSPYSFARIFILFRISSSPNEMGLRKNCVRFDFFLLSNLHNKWTAISSIRIHKKEEKKLLTRSKMFGHAIAKTTNIISTIQHLNQTLLAQNSMIVIWHWSNVATEKGKILKTLKGPHIKIEL